MARKQTPADKIIAAWYKDYDRRIARGESVQQAKRFAAVAMRWTPEYAELLPTRGEITVACLKVSRRKSDDVDNIYAQYDMSFA